MTVYFFYETFLRVLSALILSLAYISYWKACFANPGVITPENQDQFLASYPYDSLLYFSDRKCNTCGSVRVPRSKHCTVTGQCIARFDHFCGWLNNDVGELNYRWFHTFLIMNFLACFYGTYIYVMLLFGVVIEENLLESVFLTTNGQHIPASPLIVFQYMISTHLLVIAQAFFLLAIGIMLLGFWSYHMYLTLRNRTTNETFKWDDVAKLVRIIKLYRSNPTNKNPDDMKELYHRIYDDDDDEDEEEQEEKKNEAEKEEAQDTQEKETQANGEQSTSVKSRKQKAVVPPAQRTIPADKMWRYKQLLAVYDYVVKKKGTASTPPNIYSRGMIANLKEVIFPRAAYYKKGTSVAATTAPVPTATTVHTKSKKKK